MPIYDVRCPRCGESERICPIASRRDPCSCGSPIEIIYKPDTKWVPFAPYFDIALGKQVNTLADRWRFMRAKGLQYADKMSPGDVSARKDRIEQQKREQAREAAHR